LMPLPQHGNNYPTELFILDIETELRERKKLEDEANYQIEEKRRREWEKTMQSGRDSLWQYCKHLSPSYYTEDKAYLIDLCNTLQKLYKGELLKEDGTPYKKLMINMPPQHGKSRTLINFCQWVFGKDQQKRIISCSYNDDTAGDFAKYTRDGIQEERINDTGYVFSDFFPSVKVKHGSHSYYKWALEGQHFNYLGAGIGGSITGKGGDILIIDDPIKNSEEAFNEDRLEKIWNWYTGTFLSRVSAEFGEPIEIITMTRWANGDICGRILDSDEANEWYVIKLEAYDSEKDEMLCEKVLNKKRYLSLRKKMIPEIFLANYHQQTVDQQGRLYKTLKTYDRVPADKEGRPLFSMVKNYTDTADEGNDYLCSINYGIYQGEAYILDVYYTKDGMEITEDATANFLVESNVNLALIESNNGGRGFARNVQRIIWEKHKTKSVVIKWFHQSQNKMARILSQSAFVQEHIYFPVNWKDKWPEFYKSMTTFLKEGKKQADDAEDCITGVAEDLNKNSGIKWIY
jgi:predicted phage terminase large subunit-like protein